MSTSTRVAVYSRVSTSDQDCEVQLGELRVYVARRGWTVAEEYVDHGVSGTRSSRPALDRLLTDARRRKFDVVVVWALDRFGRSLRHLVTTIDELGVLGVGFIAFTQGIDTTHTSPAGTLTLQVLGCVAQFEREMCRARVRAGVAKARAQGKRLGRPRRWTPEQLDEARRLRAGGASWTVTAKAVGLAVGTVRSALAATPARNPAA